MSGELHSNPELEAAIAYEFAFDGLPLGEFDKIVIEPRPEGGLSLSLWHGANKVFCEDRITTEPVGLTALAGLVVGFAESLKHYARYQKRDEPDDPLSHLFGNN